MMSKWFLPAAYMVDDLFLGMIILASSRVSEKANLLASVAQYCEFAFSQSDYLSLALE
jgi:hypothetical protein